MRYSNLLGGGTQKRASRVRETHTFKTLCFPASVSSTREAHFQNQMSSRLRETLHFLKKYCLVYVKSPLWEATLSRAHPSPALLSQLGHGKSRVSCTRNANFALEAEARALERPRPAKTLTWRQCTHGRQTNFAKFYISKLPIHRHRTAVTRMRLREIQNHICKMGPTLAHRPRRAWAQSRH